jgi:hypothetical protein
MIAMCIVVLLASRLNDDDAGNGEVPARHDAEVLEEPRPSERSSSYDVAVQDSQVVGERALDRLRVDLELDRDPAVDTDE